MAIERTEITTIKDRTQTVAYYPRTCSDAVYVDGGSTLTDEINYIRQELRTKVDYNDSTLKDMITFNDLEPVTGISELAKTTKTTEG